MSTPDDIAQRVLDEHCIQDHWRRDGEQIRDLLVEAVELDRSEPGMTLHPSPVREDHIMGLREHAASITFNGGTAVLDHGFGFSNLTLGLTVKIGETTYEQTVGLSDFVTDWVTRIVKQHELEAGR